MKAGGLEAAGSGLPAASLRRDHFGGGRLTPAP
jgi:hypothetical protein